MEVLFAAGMSRLPFTKTVRVVMEVLFATGMSRRHLPKQISCIFHRQRSQMDGSAGTSIVYPESSGKRFCNV
jgi:hypothetical protein